MMRLVLTATMLSAVAATPICSDTTCCHAITHGMCTGNTHAPPNAEGVFGAEDLGSGDVTCGTGYSLKATAATTASAATDTDAERRAACCDADTCATDVCTAAGVNGRYTAKADQTLSAGTAADLANCCDAVVGKCTDNGGGTGDFTCGDGYSLKATAADIASAATDTDAVRTTACCDADTCATDVCTAAENGRYTDKADQTLSAGTAADVENCCDAVVGKCTDNGGGTGDFTCGTGYHLKATAADIASAATDTDAVRTAACCDADTCEDITCTGIDVKKAAADQPAAGTVATVANCCEAPASGYCAGLKDSDDDDSDLDTYACGTDKYAKQLYETASCTGTASDGSSTCDLDETTDSSAACPAGCVEVTPDTIKACPVPDAEDKTAGAATAAPLAVAAVLAAVFA